MAVAELSTIVRHGKAGASTSTLDAHEAIDDSFKQYSNSIQRALKGSFGASRTAPANENNRGFSKRTNAGRELGGSGFSLSERLPQPLPRLKPFRARSSLHALQEWEGYVTDIFDDEFVARLTDLTANAQVEEEEAMIPLEEISEDDAAKLRLGSVFRWIIGYERSGAGTKKRVSQIVFRDLPVVTRSDVQDGKAWARETLRLLNP